MRYEELGLDRRHNRYWQFGCGQPGSARIVVELQVCMSSVVVFLTIKCAAMWLTPSCTA